MSYSAQRIERLRGRLEEEGLGAMYLRNLSNILWLSAFDGVFDGEAAHALFLSPRRCIVHTDLRYGLAMKKAASGTAIEVDLSDRSHAEWLAALLENEAALADALLGIEDDITLAEYRKLQSALAGIGTQLKETSKLPTPHVILSAAAQGAAESKDPRGGLAGSECLHSHEAFAAQLKETSKLVVNLRSVKDEEETRRLRLAQSITDAAFAHIVGFIQPGMSEREVQIELEDFMVRNGASSLAFPSIVASGANGASPHAIAGETKLEAGCALVLDFGARVLDYCSDMTRTVFIGAPSERMAAAYAAVRQANEELEAFLKPGVTGVQAQALTERILAERGFAGAMGHSLGQGVGIEFHEEPSLSKRNPEALVEGNVVTVEPGVYFADEFGIRIEDFGIITRDGFEVFTKSSHDMVII
ncbi:MAG: M24 family metallopeptidase [Eggerthellaceae bacterium]|nr:M24 family metallopeptidase [Eggerthellaceae bacterium]